MSWRAIALFMDRAKAEPIRQWLMTAGFPSQIRESPPFKTLWSANPTTGGVRLEVQMDQFDRAERALLEWDVQTNALRDAIRCPECRSLYVAYPQYARHSLLTNLTMGLAARLGVVKRYYFCENCNFTWRLQEMGHVPVPQKA